METETLDYGKTSAPKVKVEFKTGYCAIHPDVGLNYQMNRFSDGSEQMISEMREVAPRIHNYDDYTREFLALSEKAYAQRTLSSAANLGMIHLHQFVKILKYYFYTFPMTSQFS